MAVGSSLRRHWAALATAALIVSAYISGLIGLDFGYHPDEWEHHLHVLNSATTGSLLPGGYYVYPSLIHWVSLTGSGIWKLTTGGLITEMPLEEFVLPARAIALAIAVAGGWGLYLAGRRLAGTWAGFTAAGIYLTSWHLAFHARWLAPDAMLAAVTAFFIWALVSRWTFPTSRRWALVAAALVGFATSTKYQGAALLLPVLIATWFLTRDEAHRIRAAAKGWARDVIVSFLAFLLITPGAVLEPTHFVRDLIWNLDHYEDGHKIYFFNIMSETIFDPLRYALAVAQYVTTTMASSYLVASLVIMALALVGVWALMKRDWRLSVLLVLPPVFLLLYFSTLTVFFPRNFLLILPFIAVLAGTGLQFLITLVPRPWSIGLRILVVAMIIVFTIDLWRAAATIDQQGPQQRAEFLAARMTDEPDACWRISDAMVESMMEFGITPSSTPADGPREERVAFSTAQFALLADDTQLRAWPGYVPGYFDWLGSREVDFSYYPSWPGEQRVLVFTPELRDEVGLTDEMVTDLGVQDACWSV